MPLEEVAALAMGRCAAIYHHNTRRRGGHDAEADYWPKEFDTLGLAVRATAYSPRILFVRNPDVIVDGRVRAFCHQWRDLSVRLPAVSLPTG